MTSCHPPVPPNPLRPPDRRSPLQATSWRTGRGKAGSRFAGSFGPDRVGAAGDGARQPTPPPVTAPALPPAQPELPAPIRSGRAEAAPRSSLSSPTPRAGKAGYALLMRTRDGEEAVHPFRSLDELLSAAKPILRTAARSPEPIWFSIQQVDLEALEDDV